MRKRVLVGVLAIVLLAGLMACGGNKTIDWSTLNPANISSKDLSLMFLTAYNSEFATYISDVSKPNLTDADKARLRDKKQIMRTVWPLIDIYDTAVGQGKPIDPVAQQQIISLLAKLTAKAIAGK